MYCLILHYSVAASVETGGFAITEQMAVLRSVFAVVLGKATEVSLPSKEEHVL